MQIISFSILTVFCLLILCSIHVRDLIRNRQIQTQPGYLGDVAISCGSDAKSIAADGRQWIGDESSAHLHLDQPKAKSRSSVAVDIAVSADPGPYRTARISAYEFRYTFQVKPGHKIIRLHFHPILYTSFEKSRDFFTVKSGPFTLVENFSASITAEALGLKYIVKEFCLKVEKNGQLSLIFYPVQHSSKSKKNTHAFVNGIEIISISAGLYFTAEGGVEALAVGRNYAAHVDDHTALETVQRLNTGGSTISPMEDFGLFRRWDADTDYLFNSFVYPSDDQTYTNIPASLPRYIAPMRLYQTSWKSGSQRSAIEDMHNYTWRIPVDPGFAYCVRLHLGGLGTQMPEGSLIQFNILINNQIAETEANIMIWDGGYGTPVFRDYMEVMKGKKEGGKRDLFISLQSTDVKVVSLLNGIEVFKLSDLENSLASPNPVNRKRTSVFWMTKIQHLLLAFSRSHGNMAGMIILITFINTVVYSMRRLWEEDFQWEKDTGSGSTEPYLHCFSIAEMREATNNFSEVNVIGRGGFGKVYKGSVPRIPETLAIKRLNSNSKQGACEFWSEIETLSKLHHIHLVSLIGYCNESQEMILAYKFMHRGTLADNLYKFGKRNKEHLPLSWEQRLRICIGAARGLDFLHTGYGIIHRDVKDSNILLDENFEAKISDCGLSKLEKLNQSISYVSTKVKGTYGYLDPDYRDTHKLTRKSDVYSFGVVLLVVLSGRPVLDTSMPEELQNLMSSYRNFSEKAELEKVVDPELQGIFASDSLNIYVNSIERCLQRKPKERPTMAQVVASLEDALKQHRAALFPTSKGGNAISRVFKERPNKHVRFNEESLLPIRELYTIFPTEGLLNNASFQVPFQEKITNLRQKGVVRKQLWERTWETLWGRGKPIKKKNMVPSDERCSQLSITDIQAATDSFRDDLIILKDKYKVVYRGQVEQPLMIYRFVVELDEKEILDFCNEIDMLSQLRHSCLLPVVGYAFHENEVFIVYEYSKVTVSTLQYCLYNQEGTRLSWKQRLRICISVARGLDHLHKGKVIHRDMKPDSILLDRDMTWKITNFGLSKVGPAAQFALNGINSSCSEYLSPDILYPAQPLTEKTDVYSFGLVLLEVLCCHRECESRLNIDVGGRYLHHVVKRSLKDQTLHDAIDPNINREIAVSSLITFLRTAFSCLLLQAGKRPTADIIVDTLEAALRAQEEAEAAKEDSKGKGKRGFDLADIYNYSVQDIAPDEVFKHYALIEHDYIYSGMSQEIFVSDDLKDRRTDDG